MRPASLLVRAAIVAIVAFGSARPAPAEPEEFELVVRLGHRDGSRIANGRITVLGPDAEKGPPWAFERVADADAQGEATFRLPKAGLYDVETVAPGHRSVGNSIEMKDSKFPLTYVIQWAPSAVVPVKVLVQDVSGTRVGGARVRIERERRDDDETKPPIHDATTDSTGTAMLNVEGAGTWAVRVRHPMYVSGEVSIELAAGDEERAKSLTLEPKPGADRPKVPSHPPTKDDGLAGPRRPPSKPDDPAPPTRPAATSADFAGRWRHVSGTTIEFVQTAAGVTGTWSHLDSRVTGTVRARVLDFTTTSPKGLECEGSVTLDAAGGAFFGEARVTRSDTDVGRRFHFDAERAR